MYFFIHLKTFLFLWKKVQQNKMVQSAKFVEKKILTIFIQQLIEKKSRERNNDSQIS